MTAEELIRRLDLKAHPEGGFYRETYRSPTRIPGVPRAHSTAIYYMLVPGSVSKLHRLRSDELFHFYMGDPVTWVLLETSKKVRKVILGNQLDKGQVLQMVVPAGTWFGGYLEGENFGLMGTTVAPGFEFEDFEMGKREELLKGFPDAKEEVLKLT